MLDLILPAVRGGGSDAYITFFNGKSPTFAGYFIQNNTKLRQPQTLGKYAEKLLL